MFKDMEPKEKKSTILLDIDFQCIGISARIGGFELNATL